MNRHVRATTVALLSATIMLAASIAQAQDTAEALTPSAPEHRVQPLRIYTHLYTAAWARVQNDIIGLVAFRTTLGLLVDERFRVGVLGEVLMLHSAERIESSDGSFAGYEGYHGSPVGGAEVAWRMPVGGAGAPIFDLGAHVMLGETEHHELSPDLGFISVGSLLVIAGVHGSFALPIGRRNEVSLRIEAQAYVDMFAGAAASGHAGLQWEWR